MDLVEVEDRLAAVARREAGSGKLKGKKSKKEKR